MAPAGNPVISHFGNLRHGFHRIRAEQDRRAWPLERPRRRAYVVESIVFPMKRNRLAGPEAPDDFKPFDEAAAPLAQIDTEGIELFVAITLADAEEHFAAAQIV